MPETRMLFPVTARFPALPVREDAILKVWSLSFPEGFGSVGEVPSVAGAGSIPGLASRGWTSVVEMDSLEQLFIPPVEMKAAITVANAPMRATMIVVEPLPEDSFITFTDWYNSLV
jgi:hypothetical protein